MYTKNYVQLTGNIARLPETQKAGESTVTRARLMHNELIHRAESEPMERVVAVDLDIWGKRGEAFARHVTTRVPVCVEGRLQWDRWEQDGQPRSRLLIRVEQWQFLSGRREDETRESAGGSIVDEREASLNRSPSRGERQRVRSGQR